MRSPLSFAGSILLISCVGSTVQDQTTGSEATAEETRTLSEISKNEYESADTWGQIIETPPETFFAADLSDDVRDGLTDALLVATSEWGNFGPLEYWVLGTDLDAAKDLAERFCERRSQRGDFKKSQCLSENLDPNGQYRFEYYRKIGADAIARKKAGGSMGWNGNREWGIHFYASSYPLGFDRLFGSSPAGEQRGVFHEYFHAVQQAHIFSRDSDERKALSGLAWFIEGGADYMAQTTTRKLWASGKLTTIDDSDSGSFEQSFKNKMKKGKKMIAEHCPGTKLHELTYDNDCSGAAYGLGAWAVAYLLNKVGQEALLDTFYPSLNELGWEGAFRKTFGMSSEDFSAEFSLFLEKPLADQLAILPKHE